MNAEMSDWTARFAAMNAIFKRPGVPGAPHVKVLKSPNHQDEYFNSDEVVEDPQVMRAIAEEWAAVLEGLGIGPNQIDRVISHAPYGCAPAFVLSQVLGARYGFAARDSAGGYSSTFDMRGERVLVVADDIVSGDSTRKVIADAEAKGAVVLGYVPCLGNLSLADTLDGRAIIAAATFTPERHPVDDGQRCGLCRDMGSLALSPRDNWDELQRWTTTPAAS